MTRNGKQRATVGGQHPQHQPPHQLSKTKGKRGAPQTFAATLFRILHEGTPIVGWNEEGDSFTVHNDKEFEEEVLTANYRHGKFSSFQRQLNMYGFRKVPDCSDRTYSHPYFNRDRPELLKKVRRVVPGNSTIAIADTNRGNPKRRSGAATVPQTMVTTKGAVLLAPVTPRAREGEDSCTHTTGESDNGDQEDPRPPARKKTRMCGQQRVTSSQAATGERVAAVRGRVGSGVGLFPRPLQYWGDDSGVLRNSEPVRQAKRSGVTPVAATAQTKHRQTYLPPPQSPHLSARGSNAGSSYQHELSSSWHYHTGLYGGMTNSLDERWTPGSSSSASGVSSVEALSPVLLPINAGEIEYRDSIPQFHLPPAPTATVPAAVSPSLSSMAPPSGGVATGSVGFGYNGMATTRKSVKSVTRTVSPSDRSEQKAGLYGDGVGNSSEGCRNVVSGNLKVAAQSVAGDTGDEGPLSLNKAFVFGAAIARNPVFELGFHPSMGEDTGASGKGNNPVLISPPETTAAADATVSSSKHRSEVSPEPMIGWDISALGGAGWGSPGTCDSMAAAPWAALPPFNNSSSIRSSHACMSSMRGADQVGNGNMTSNGAGPDRAAVSSGSGSGRETLQQQPFHRRTLSTMSAFSLSAGDAVEPLDWALLDNDDDDASFAGLESGEGFHVTGEALSVPGVAPSCVSFHGSPAPAALTPNGYPGSNKAAWQ